MARYYCGIDPGAETGIVAVAFPRGVLDWQEAELFRADVVRASAMHGLTHPERDLTLARLIKGQLALTQPEVIVLEEPGDFSERSFVGAKPGDSPQTRKRGTAFRLGVHYGMAVTAAGSWRASTCWEDVEIVSYPATRWAGRPGWMQGGKREHILDQMRTLARAIVVPKARAFLRDPKADAAKLTADIAHEHCLMALGVLYFHIEQTKQNALLARLPGVK